MPSLLSGHAGWVTLQNWGSRWPGQTVLQMLPAWLMLQGRWRLSLQLLTVLGCPLWLLTGAAGGVVLKTHLPQQLLSQSCRQRVKQRLLLLGGTLLQLLVQASLLRGRLRQLLDLQEQWMLQWQARLLWAQARQLQWVWVLWSSQYSSRQMGSCLLLTHCSTGQGQHGARQLQQGKRQLQEAQLQRQGTRQQQQAQEQYQQGRRKSLPQQLQQQGQHSKQPLIVRRRQVLLLQPWQLVVQQPAVRLGGPSSTARAS
jgi:hypothetical protein